MIRSILLVVLLLVVLLLIILGIIKIRNSKIQDYYDTENGYTRILKNEQAAQNRLTPFATELAVINQDTSELTDMFTAQSGLLTKCGNGNIRYTKAAMERMNPASTTKIMTALCALRYGNLDDQVVITPEAMVLEAGASLANIQPGQIYTLRQLLYGLMLPSGNDAANAIAIHISGSVDAFADLMNREAEELGAVDTHFCNPHGMTEEEHYTSAYDLYLIMNEALKYPDFVSICKTKEYNVEYMNDDGTYSSRLWKNTNKYATGDKELPDSLLLEAGKTGTTTAAGHCLVLAVSDGNEDSYISIVLKGDSTDSLYNNMDYLLSGIE